MTSREDDGPTRPKEIDPDLFYGFKKYCHSYHTNTASFVLPPQHSAKFKKLFGPSTVWRVFKKQNDLITFVSQNNCDLLPFTFQTENGDRLFLAAHPLTFWYYDQQRSMTERHSYEIIQEFKVCKLYFDLEFDTTLNLYHDGNRMVDSFIYIVGAALKYKYGISCSINDVLNLTSSTETKFSCHLIFQLKNEVFCDNYNMRYFVKQLCHEIRLWILEKNENECLLLLPEIDLPLQSVKELEIVDAKGNKKLFCDESVYSKNRHFRIYKSSKFGKNTPLLLSENNKFQNPENIAETKEEALFLYSLITWIPKDKSYVKLEFPPNELYPSKIQRNFPDSNKDAVENHEQSPFPGIDSCISNIVHPGKIWRSVFFRGNYTIVYDIIGNRFCSNIGRQHKSNNVKYIVDLCSLSYYQKCYDPDCANFKSAKKSLPISENFFLENNIDDDFIAAAEEHCQSVIVKSVNTPTAYEDCFNLSNISDEECIEAAKKCESFWQETKPSTTPEKCHQ